MSSSEEKFVVISPDQLSAEALEGLVEEFISREGTDYGTGEHSFEDKKKQVHQQLQGGDAVIVFDLEVETATLLRKEELEARLRES